MRVTNGCAPSKIQGLLIKKERWILGRKQKVLRAIISLYTSHQLEPQGYNDTKCVWVNEVH